MSNLVYVADNNTVTCRSIKTFLENEGHHIICFADSNDLFVAFQRAKCNLVIIDVVESGKDGFLAGAKIKQLYNVPIITLIGQESDDDYVLSISLGFDACITKPINPAKLIAHVRALLIKAELGKHIPMPEKRSEIAYGDITLHPNTLTAFCKNKEIKLTNTEFNLLRFLFENKDRAISRGELMNKIWGKDSPAGSRAADDTMKRLRKKLVAVESQVSIDSVWGFGFRLAARKNVIIPIA
jgi:DNA-binding response OmpR family regulator